MLSVVIPSYNEIENLRKGPLERVESYLKKQTYKYEVIVVDDGSNDGSREFVEKFASESKSFRLIKNDHMGKAGAVTTGVLEAKGDYILFSDMDQATPIEEVEKLFPYFKEDYDIVIGSRAGTRKGAPFSRKVMAEGMIVLRSLVVGIGEIKDTQCGFKMFRKKSAMDVFLRVKKIHHGFKSISGSSVTAGFDIEILYIAKKLGYKIKEVPVEWKYVETRRVSPVRDSIEGFIDLLRLRKNIISGVYSNKNA